MLPSTTSALALLADRVLRPTGESVTRLGEDDFWALLEAPLGGGMDANFGLNLRVVRQFPLRRVG